jgi:hypothetical protein
MVGAQENYEARCRHCHDVPRSTAGQPPAEQNSTPSEATSQVDPGGQSHLGLTEHTNGNGNGNSNGNGKTQQSLTRV